MYACSEKKSQVSLYGAYTSTYNVKGSMKLCSGLDVSAVQWLVFSITPDVWKGMGQVGLFGWYYVMKKSMQF